jgi:hypothetical protein
VRNVERQVLRLLQEETERLPDLVRRYHLRIDGRDERGGHLLLAAVAVHGQSDELLDEDVVQLQVAQLVQGARDLADVVRGEVLLGEEQRFAKRSVLYGDDNLVTNQFCLERTHTSGVFVRFVLGRRNESSLCCMYLGSPGAHLISLAPNLTFNIVQGQQFSPFEEDRSEEKPQYF